MRQLSGRKAAHLFLLTPLREGRPYPSRCWEICGLFLLTPLREGRRIGRLQTGMQKYFYSRPCGRGDRRAALKSRIGDVHFYSRPCGRGDGQLPLLRRSEHHFYSRPCGRGDCSGCACRSGISENFYSRPCGRGDTNANATAIAYINISTHAPAGGATIKISRSSCTSTISTHAPAGGATGHYRGYPVRRHDFYSRPCGRGDNQQARRACRGRQDFYSRPCGRGDSNFPQVRHEVLRQIAER